MEEDYYPCSAKSYYIWEIDEMPEEELQRLFPDELIGRQHKAKVMKFLDSHNLLLPYSQVQTSKPFNFVYHTYLMNNLPLEGILYSFDEKALVIYAAHLSNERLMKKLHDVYKFGDEMVNRLCDGRMSLNDIFKKAGKRSLEQLLRILLLRELKTREGKLGTYLELSQFIEDNIGEKIDMEGDLLIYGTDEERNTVDLFSMSTFYIEGYLRSAPPDRIKDAIRYLHEIGISDKLLLWISATNTNIIRIIGVEKNLCDSVVVMITLILDFIGYKPELFSELTSKYVLDVIDDYFSQV